MKVAAALILAAGTAQAGSLDALLAELSPLDRAQRCGGAVVLALSEGSSPVLTAALRNLAFAAMAEGAFSERVQQAMFGWAEAYAAQPDRVAFRGDRPRCLALAESLAP